MPRLPIFPLGTVLYPDGRIPLQIFEPRYIELLRMLVERAEDERRFGIVAIRRGHEVESGAGLDLYGVGCECRVDALVATQRGARPLFHIVVTGTRRFRLDALDPDVDTPYLVSGVTWLPDTTDGDHAQTLHALAEQVRAAHAVYLSAVGVEPGAPEARPHRLPWRVVEKMQLDLRDRQSVLEAPDAAARLRAVLALLRRENALLSRFHALPSPPLSAGPGLN